MNYHIVRVNEKIEKIASIYSLNISEIIDINHHIKDWSSLVPGTKLRLPEIPEIVEEELNNTEPFIEEYYPKIDPVSFIKKEEIIQKENYIPDTSLIVEQKEIKKEENQSTKKPTYNPYYNPYYYYGYYPNYYNQYRSKKRKKK